MYSQLFETLYFHAENECDEKRLPIPVRFILDEFANSVTRSTPKMIKMTNKSVA